MRRTSVVRFLTSLIIASLASAGPLAPLAHGQQGDQSAEVSASPAEVTQPASTPPAEATQSTPAEATQPQPTPPAEVTQSAPMPPTETTQAQATPPAEVAQAQPTPPAGVAQPVPPAPPVQVAPVAPPPPQPAYGAQPAQPDLFQETLKAQRASDRSQALYNLEAVVVSVFLFPGRIVTCAAGTLIGVGLLTVSLGTGYRAATGIFHEGCGGKWIVTGDDLRPDTPPSLVVTDPGR